MQVLNGWLNPYERYRKARDEDTLAVNAWLLAYATVNLYAVRLDKIVHRAHVNLVTNAVENLRM